MARTLFFHMVLRKTMKNTNKKPILTILFEAICGKWILNQVLVNTMLFTNISISLFNLYSDLLSIISKKISQIRNNLVYVVAHLIFLFCCALTRGPLQCFSAYFRKSKEIGVLQPIFLDYVFSFDYIANGLLTRWGMGSGVSGECLYCTCESQFNSCFITV